MLNYWWVTRPKRKLNSIPEVLATFAENALNQEWEGQRNSHLAYEEALEEKGLKRVGERRDQTGGGARTYKAWLMSLGLIFTQEATGKIKLTLAGEAILNGDSPVSVLKNQIIKYQFPSAFSLSWGVNVASRFKIRPFRFLLRLLQDSRVAYLTEEEIAKIVVTEAENETDKCYEYIVKRILDFRNFGDSCLEKDFLFKYKSSRGGINLAHPYSHLTDLANTLVNWLEYTQLIKREEGKVSILTEKTAEVNNILATRLPFIDRPNHTEYFQRKYGVDPKHKKDDRNLLTTINVTPKVIAIQKVKSAFITMSLEYLITGISADLVNKIAIKTGLNEKLVEEILVENYPHGSVNAFMTKYFEMAFKGRDEASDFEKSTAELFRKIFGFQTKHVGPIGLTPDVLLYSELEGYQAIIDNKAYSKYSISNDHHNRMVHNYLANISKYSDKTAPIAFFTYIAGGFVSNIDTQLKSIINEAGINGSAITVSNVIKLVELNETHPLSHKRIKELLGINRQVIISDIV